MDFLSVGEMVIDFLPGNEAGVYIRKAGGAPANVAIALARQGCDAAFCGMMGNDDFGRFLLETLRDNGVKPLVTDLTNDAITTMAFVTLNEFGDRSFTFARKPGADMFLNRSHIKDEYLDNTSIVHAGSCSLSKGDAVGATVYALQEGCRRGKLVSFDVNYRNLLWDNDRTAASVAVMKILPFVDILKISEDEIDMIGGEEEIPKLMRECDIAMVVETLGANGARCFWNGEIISLDGIKAECVDATGAGDAFWGGFLSVIIKCGIKTTSEFTKEIIEKALRCGNISGWLCVRKKGAIESLPTAHEVEAHMRELYV